MPTVETTITISIPEGGMTLGELEAAIMQAVEEAGRRLLLAACREMEEQALRELRGRVQQVKVRPLDMLTRFGWARLERRQVVDREKGCYWCPLDDVLGLAPRQHASPWVQRQAVALATRIPYRQATAFLSGWLGMPLDHRTVYAWVQQAGQAIVEEEDARQEAVFEDGEQPVSDPRVREIVVTEVDGTFVKAQREGVPNFEVRMDVLFSGKELESATAKHKRYRLKERVLYGGVEAAEAFGERLFLAGEAKLGVSIARALANDPDLVLADEPTANLDSKQGREVVQLLRDIAREQGRTVVIVSHDERIRQMADRVLWLEDGRLREDGGV